MWSKKTRSTRDQCIPRSLQRKMSFDEILDFTDYSILVKWRLDLKKETENIICWTGKQREIIWLVCVPAVHGLRTSMLPQFSTTTYCVVLLNQHDNPPQHCHVPCHGGSMEGSRAAQTLTLSSIDRGGLRFFSGVQQQQHNYSYTHTPKPTQ